MKQAIENERRLEFAQEGQRWDDLVRFGNVKEVMNSLNEVNLKTGAKMVYNMTDAKIYVPIPQNEIDRNPLLK
ncbi:SusD family protein [compost metagenome]